MSASSQARKRSRQKADDNERVPAEVRHLEALAREQVLGEAAAGAAVTVITNGARNPCCKVFSWTPGGKLNTKHQAQVYEGTAERRLVASLAELADLVASLQANQALTYGAPDAAEAPIVTLEALERSTLSVGGVGPPEWA